MFDVCLGAVRKYLVVSTDFPEYREIFKNMEKVLLTVVI